GVTTRSVQPDRARTTPSAPAADSSARTAVVPTAITRPPRSRVASTRHADSSGTANRSGYGGSCTSADATPVCSVTGANRTPRLTSSVTVRAVNGRAALGISALPAPSGDGSANTVWYADSGWSRSVYAYRIGRPYSRSSP